MRFHGICGVLSIAFLLSAAIPAFAHEGIGAHLDHVNEALRQHPDSQSLYIERGAVYSGEAGMHERALEDFQLAERLGPPVAVAYELGMLYYRTEKFDRAIAYFDKYIEQFPAYAPPYEYRAKALYALGADERARADYDEYFRLETRPNPGSYIAAAQMRASPGAAKNLAEAIALLDSGMNRIGLNPQMQNCAIELELKRSRPQAAIARQRSLKNLLGAGPVWQIDMAELLLADGKRGAANRLLADAEAQLSRLKVTPARLDLSKKIRSLKERSRQDSHRRRARSPNPDT